ILLQYNLHLSILLLTHTVLLMSMLMMLLHPHTQKLIVLMDVIVFLQIADQTCRPIVVLMMTLIMKIDPKESNRMLLKHLAGLNHTTSRVRKGMKPYSGKMKIRYPNVAIALKYNSF